MLQQPILILLNAKNYMLPCLNKRLFGIDCPGCGLQRSVHLLFHGEFLAAFKMYPAIYPILALLIFLVSNIFMKLKYGHQIKLFLMLLTAGTIILSYIIKMNNLFT
ncbi:DUF2752 domain-containing protein [Flagellimonas eckloniae]|uniref:DUF2752 domain-containing protein n=1 Tax=Flagellimonas eckloniae TaxID=346185 RepID=A0A0Q1DIM7_9FLAO|nr:DUF2752 domain-containing protein [Allomuricauda eckloniae]KQC28542.1 hypothetical protein AAY42_00475 [Allomuricauda eckloniae]